MIPSVAGDPLLAPATLVPSLTYKPGWSFKAAGPGGRFLCVFSRTPDSVAPERERMTQHQFEFPADAMTREGFARWVFACLMKAEFHEAAEFLQVDGQRPFFPYHQDEGSPYAWVERWQ
jgi:hypothetical protein